MFDVKTFIPPPPPPHTHTFFFFFQVNEVQEVRRERTVLDREESLVQLVPWVRAFYALTQMMYLDESHDNCQEKPQVQPKIKKGP